MMLGNPATLHNCFENAATIAMTFTNFPDKKIGTAPWLNWIEQPPPKGQVSGSNPLGVTIFTRSVWSGKPGAVQSEVAVANLAPILLTKRSADFFQ